MDLKVIYADIPEEFVFDNTVFEASEINEAYSNLLLFRKILNAPKHYATLELNKWKLDGSYTPVNNDKIPYWSVQVSEDTASDGRYNFTSPITITCTFEIKHTVTGLSIITDDECYSNYVHVKWYSDDALKASQYYMPDSSVYFCEADGAENINKAVVTFYSMNKANRYLKLYGLVHGGISVFTADDVIDTNIVEEISLQCTELPAFSAEITLKSANGNVFRSLSPFQILRNNISRGTFYIDTSEQVGENVYRITGYNFISLLEYYNTDKCVQRGITFEELLQRNILNNFFLTYSIDATIADFTVGNIFVLPEGSSREGLLQLVSATGILYTISRDNEMIFKQDSDSNTYVIPETDIFNDVSVTEPCEKYNIILNRNIYSLADTSGEDHGLNWRQITELPSTYDESYVGQIFNIKLDNTIPAWTMSLLYKGSLTDPKGLELVSYSPYDCYIKITGNYITSNNTPFYVAYVETVTSTTQVPLLISTTKYGRLTAAEKVIDNVYFSDECDALQEQRTKNYYKNDKTLECTIIMPENLQCGDRVQFASDKYDNFSGIVEQIEYSLNGGQKLIGKVKVHAYG